MTEKFFSIREENEGYGVESTTATPKFFKLLNESLNTTREDFYIDTTQYWSTPERAEGYFRTSGSIDILVDPVIFPNVLVHAMGDPKLANGASGSVSLGSSVYKHTWLIGYNEEYSSENATTGIKSFTTHIGQGIEKDRVLYGCLFGGFSLEAVAREHFTCSLDVFASGHEKLVANADPYLPANVATGYTLYTQPYFTFNNVATMTIGAADRIDADPLIEAFRMRVDRGWDQDLYTLGKRYIGRAMQHGMVNVNGSMDFAFTSENEHERFLSAVGTYETGDQTQFETVIGLQGATAGGAYKYSLTITIPKTSFTASTTNLNARDRIVQKVDWRGSFDLTSKCAAQIDIQNLTSSYA